MPDFWQKREILGDNVSFLGAQIALRTKPVTAKTRARFIDIAHVRIAFFSIRCTPVLRESQKQSFGQPLARSLR